ncbi:MAG: DNA-binding protein Alba [Candidatus Micrarchaeota archaeon]|nr:DNA-binding protein Alba [Candidatus Micrarchaeota archaeon]MCX8154269.1 DNA-binding protein Alba [Candidatus Micrarchaeota archaeon]
MPETKPQDADNVVLVGKKPTIGYVLAVLTQLSQGAKEVVIRARGKQIARAVTVLELLKRKYRPDLKVKAINTSTEDVPKEDGKVAKVSAIEIIIEA